ncbi:amidase [Pelagicoccus sp. SDUM812003]|uniref:amidase n=1 Tax=Pelagicoccus sp. SDUM812003 TaxID=3041267 RepID=UPI00280DC806|nr:amidase [Pelagicoccus sp. SDUM812003]MDQ8204678.1 amidase [Pelagicoccus sp. SDUM812003]
MSYLKTITRWSAMLACAASLNAETFDLSRASIAEIQSAIDAGKLSSEKLVQLCLNRIEAYDKKGPELKAIFHLSPDALDTARRLDAERAQSGKRSALHGIPVIVKDLVDVAELPTTGGFKPFGTPVPARDAEIVRRIKEAGGIILAKAATTNWFGNGFDETHFHGPTKNAYNPLHFPGSSSNGPGAAMAAWYAPIAIGTDTGGSVRIPSAHSGLAGMVATQGMVSRAGIMPRGATQDRAGPMGRSIEDIATMLTVISGWDVEDVMTFQGSGHYADPSWLEEIKAADLRGKRIGVLREMIYEGPEHEEGLTIFKQTLEALESAGAQIIDPVVTGLDLKTLSTSRVGRTAEYEKIFAQNAYLARFGDDRPYASIQEMIASNDDALFSDAMHSALELEHPDTSPEYQARLRLRTMLRSAISDTIDTYDLDALIFPFSTLPPRRIDSDQPRAPGGSNSLASNNGLPSIILPGGYTSENLPIGIEFISKPFADLELLKVAAGAEKAMEMPKLPTTTPALSGEVFDY